MQTSILIQREERLGVGFEPATQVRPLSPSQVFAQGPIVAKGTTDAARALSKQHGRNRERAPASVDLPGFLWRSQFNQPTLAGIDVQRPKQRPHANGTDDFVGREPTNAMRDLLSDERGDRPVGHIDEHHRFGSGNGKRMNEYPAHAREFLAMRVPLAFEPLRQYCAESAFRRLHSLRARTNAITASGDMGVSCASSTAAAIRCADHVLGMPSRHASSSSGTVRL